MRELRRFASLPQAQEAGRYLIDHGVLAAVEDVSPRAEYYPGLQAFDAGRFRLMLVTDDDREVAESLLHDLDREEAVLPADWESQSHLDPAGLDPALLPDCPRCRAGLSAETARTGRCLTCGEVVDVLGLVVERHGPEALDGLHDDTPDWPDDALLERFEIACHSCGYPLGGLVIAGSCPECGRAYDKRELIERLLNPGSRRG
ncbi:MAG: hypothetical protein AAFR38_00810 [Planctomycetota bacterium]